MTESTSNQKRSISLLRWIGYGLLFLALLNIAEIFIPLDLMNPAWKIQLLSALVEGVVLPLLGLGMVFYGQANYREDWEIHLLKGLSWACLLVGTLFVLLIPMGINTTVQLYSQAQIQVDTQVKQQVSQIQQFKTQLSQAEGKNLESLFIRLNRNGTSLPINNPQKLEDLKSRFLEKISLAEKTIHSQGEVIQSNQRFMLLKKSIKFNLGALICGILFVRIWRITRWARRLT